MSKQTEAKLLGFSKDFIKSIEEMCHKRDSLHKEIVATQKEQKNIQRDIGVLTEKLSQISQSMAKRMAERNAYDRTIQETEIEYKRIREILLNPLAYRERQLREKREEKINEQAQEQAKKT
ncbi:Sjoegren syndrome nuclear autoantigen 1 homolog [Lingula anatina]|uniref:Sjoegren syndrome nuclear autoantigen 1 homolog n=1 Tax=Lingula anatina TaxID=7574 RepID=A0A1S3JUZ4_LINAN|nr:Sjoegren syndrome nuclear autoantigen 1 homolog [Lingula anatina]|eukprot:XP_013414195.1 Sjoegren syndrome nuclear autoantigen 1 homolog [Lingula anatina]